MRIRAKADDAERDRREQLKIRAEINPLRELACHRDVLADSRCEAFDSKVAHNEPKLDRTEAASELRSVIHEVLNFVCIARAQVFRHQAKGLPKHIHSLAE